MSRLPENECLFQTERLKIFSYREYAKNQTGKRTLSNRVISIMTPKVTESLPAGWQNLHTDIDANNWINEVSEESNFLLVQLKKTNEIVGFIFLYEPVSSKTPMHLRLGYLLSEDTWGHGMGSELIKGLLVWCRSTGNISTITGGVEPGNISSIKVLEKNGFIQTDPENEGTLFFVYDFCQQK
jgi:RimJ/RimL family protein N-acetyltransferase